MGQPLFGDCVRYSLGYTSARENAELPERHIFYSLSYSPNPQVVVNTYNSMRSVFWAVLFLTLFIKSKRGFNSLLFVKGRSCVFFRAGVSYNQVLKGPEDNKQRHKSLHHQLLMIPLNRPQLSSRCRGGRHEHFLFSLELPVLQFECEMSLTGWHVRTPGF